MAVQPEPTPPPVGYEVLIDLGIISGPPELPPDNGMAELGEGTVVAVLDLGHRQRVMGAAWNGSEWRATGTFDAALLPPNEELAFRRVSVTDEDGFPEDALLLVGRVPGGPVNQIEVTVDGEPQRYRIGRPVAVLVFPADVELGDRFRTIDAGTHVLGEGVILADE